MPYYRDALPYYYGGPFSNHSSLMTGIGRTIHSPLGSSRYAPLLSTISESPLSALRRYSPAATISARPKRVIDTADIDVSTPRTLSHSNNTNNHQKNRLRRDRPTIRIRSQALKDNPALRQHYERHEKTVGELLVEKFLIKDKKPDSDREIPPKNDSQTILESVRDKNQSEDQLAAIQRRVTRRMTRRRSSADIQMDPEQLEREVLIAQAQADALDTLVAQEQAEIEVETRMGTLIRKNLIRATSSSVLGKHESQTGDEDDGTRIKKLAKKVKKRKKTTDKPSPPRESESELGFDAEMQKTSEDKVAALVDDIDSDTGDNSFSNKAIKLKVEASNSVGDFSTLWINASAAEEQQMQLTKSQDFVDQFRDSVRLPAPKLVAKVATGKKKETSIEEHHQVIVLPVKKRYIKDDSRNSVYLTLKTQKNDDAPKVNGDLVNRVGNVDDLPALRSNHHPDDHSRPMTTSLSAGPQSKGQKVAKFRSKDITESDAEVKSISELLGGVEEIGERQAKDVDHDQPLMDSGRSKESEKKLISLTDNSNETSEGFGHLASRSQPSKVFSVNADAKTHVKDYENHGISSLGKVSFGKKAFSREAKQVVAPDNGADAEEASEATKHPKDSTKLPISDINDKQSENSISCNQIGEREKVIKCNVSTLDSSDLVAAVQCDKTKSDKREKLEDTDEVVASILSVVSPVSIAGSLPNATTINSINATNIKTAQLVKSSGTSINPLLQENQKLDTDNTEVHEALTEVSKTSVEVGEAETLIPFAVTKTATEINDSKCLSEVISKPEVNCEHLMTESPKNGTPIAKSNLFDFGDDCKVAGKNVVDASELQINEKNLEKIPKLDCTQSDAVQTESGDLKVVPTSYIKSVRALKKRVIPKAKEDRSPLSPVEKAEPPIVATENSLSGREARKIKKNLTEIQTKARDLSKTEEKSSKLTNGSSKVKPKLIEEIKDNRELAKAEKLTLKIWNKPYTPSIPEDDGIDFWGEIESQKLEKPVPKSEIVATETKEVQKIAVAEKTPIDLKPELKPNLPTETSTSVAPKVAEAVVGKENKPNKMKKKKTTELGVDKKKDQEKPTAETILKRVISEGGGDENGSQQQQQHQQQLQALSRESLEKEKSEKKSCESQETNRFERNLSTIAEENSPVSPDVPTIESLASVIFDTQEKSTEQKLETLTDLVSDKLVITASKEPELISTLKTKEPEVSSFIPVPAINEVIKESDTKDSKVSLTPALVSLNLPITESSVPIINIEAAPGTPPNNEDNELSESQLEAVILEEEQEGPETPSNEATNDPPNNISKWTSQADLCLDEPDKDIGPQVSVETKTGSSKKKTSTKKSSSKKSSKGSSGSNSANSTGTSPDSSKKKKLGKRKKLSGKSGNSSEKRTIFEERSESKISNSSDTTLKPSYLNLRNSPKNSPRNTPKQRPLDLIKMFYTTPASLLTATPRDLSKVRRAKIKKKKHSTRTASASSNSTGSTRSTQSTGTTESNGSTERDEDVEQKRISSTRSNDSGFDGSPRLSNCDMACHKKCEKLTGNLCGLNQKLVAEALQALKRDPRILRTSAAAAD